jgi:hypothetical protein
VEAETYIETGVFEGIISKNKTRKKITDGGGAYKKLKKGGGWWSWCGGSGGVQ